MPRSGPHEHGATVGQVDEAQLFYLESRGLKKDEATKLLLEGFFEQVIGKLKVEALADHLRRIVDRKL